jgi:hypothetical protein
MHEIGHYSSEIEAARAYNQYVIERKLDNAATKAEFEKEIGECKRQISDIQKTYTTREQHQNTYKPPCAGIKLH